MEESTLQTLFSGKGAFGLKHLSAIRAKKALGTAYSAQGKLVPCGDGLLEAWNASVDLVGHQHPLTISIRTDMADAYEKAGQESDAAALKEHA